MTIAASSLVAVALGVSGLVSVRVRSAELTANLEAQTQTVGATLRVALEAALQEGFFEDVRKLVARLQAAEPPVHIAYIELTAAAPTAPRPSAEPLDGGVPHDGGAAAIADTSDDGGDDSDEPALSEPPPDPTRAERLRRISIDGQPYGEHIERDGHYVYALAVPLKGCDKPELRARDCPKRVVAAIDLTRDEGDARAALSSTTRNVALSVLLAGLGLALLLWLTTRSALSHPLQRLVEGIDEVTVGDLTRVILRERDDEIGDLADRFNQMTTSLREARAETERGVEARLALEARLRHSEKLATIGQLAASIAHEVGTPLNVIGGRARSMEKKADSPTDVAKNAGIIAAQASRITKIIQQLLDFARKKAAVRAPVDLPRVVQDTLDFLEHHIVQARVNVRVRPFAVEAGEGAPLRPMVLGDADQLQQVTLNLCMNAIQSMSGGGTLEVACIGIARRKPGLETAPLGRYIKLEVADTGVGIAPEDRERVFEAFYSTKPDAEGTGLGLAVSQGIVKDHDGWIEIEERPGGGTLFIVYLPSSESTPPS